MGKTGEEATGEFGVGDQHPSTRGEAGEIASGPVRDRATKSATPSEPEDFLLIPEIFSGAFDFGRVVSSKGSAFAIRSKNRDRHLDISWQANRVSGV